MVTRNSSSRLANAIALARRFADEVVIGVDEDSSDGTWEIAAGLADTAFHFRHPNQLAPAHMLALQFCTGEWILRLDDDELMEAGFEDILPELLTNPMVTHYWLPRKWVVSYDPPEYVHAWPWYPDFQLRLMRNDPALFWKPPVYHTGFKAGGAGARESRFSILHFEPLLCSTEERKRKTEVYRNSAGTGHWEEVLGEKAGEKRRLFKPLPVLNSSKPAHQHVEAAVRTLEIRQFPPWGCKFLSVDIPEKMIASETVVASFTIQNTGNMTWFSQQTGWPLLRISHHLKSATGEMMQFENARIELDNMARPGEVITVLSTFTAPADPGTYILTWDMVSEFECWFADCGSETFDTPVVVTAQPAERPGRELHRLTCAVNSNEPFFIVGCPRSGTTLLSVLLDRHSRIAVPPETAFFDDIAPFLPSVEYDAGNTLKILHDSRMLVELRMTPRAVVERIGSEPFTPASVLSAILDLYAQSENKQRCGEKTPQHLLRVPEIARQFPGAKIVCILRDGRETALSLNSMPWWQPRTLADAATLWKQCMERTGAFVLDYPASFRTWRYEDLVTHPGETLSSILEFLGETFEPAQLDSTLQSRVVLSRSMEWKGDALQSVDTNRPGRRLAAASPRELAFLNEIMGGELRRHGYA